MVSESGFACWKYTSVHTLVNISTVSSISVPIFVKSCTGLTWFGVGDLDFQFWNWHLHFGTVPFKNLFNGRSNFSNQFFLGDTGVHPGEVPGENSLSPQDVHIEFDVSSNPINIGNDPIPLITL